MKTEFCCDVFIENILEAGRKGFSIIPYKTELKDSFCFFLQFRSVDYQEGNDFSKIIISQRAITYCPWCGVKLSEIALLKREELEVIARKNNHLVI